MSDECRSISGRLVAFFDRALVSVRLGRTRPKAKKDSGWSTWKMNESLLEDEPLVEKLRKLFVKQTKLAQSTQLVGNSLKKKQN